MPPALLLERNLKASLMPQHVLRTSQTEILAHVAPLCIISTATHVQGSLDTLEPFCNKTPEAAFDVADSSAAGAASAVARALSSLALASEVVRVVPNVLEQLTSSGARGQSLISNVSKLELMAKSLVTTMNNWLDSPVLRKRLGTVAESLSDTSPSSAGEPLETARVSAILARVSSKENKLANRMAVAVPHLQLLALLQSNIDIAVRNFHLSVCKSVHHPSSRNRRAGGNALSQGVDPATGCILNSSSRLCLAYLVQGRKQSLDRSVVPGMHRNTTADGGSGSSSLWPPQTDENAAQPSGIDSAMEGVDERLHNLSPREALAAMQHLTMMADDVRMCLFEMRRKEYFALALGYFNAIGGIQSISARFHDAVQLAQVVHAKAEEEQQQKAADNEAANKANASTADAVEEAGAAAPETAAGATEAAVLPGDRSSAAAAATEPQQPPVDTEGSEMQVDGDDATAAAEAYAAGVAAAAAPGEQRQVPDGVTMSASDQNTSGISDYGVPRLGSMYFDVMARQWCFAFDAQSGTAASAAASNRSRNAATGADGAAPALTAGAAGVAAIDNKPTPAKLVQSSWAAAAKYVPQMLSTYLTFFSLLLHRRALISHPSASLLGQPLPDAEGVEPSKSSIRPSDVALHSIQTAAAKAVLMLWDAATAFKPSAVSAPPADPAAASTSSAAAPAATTAAVPTGQHFLPVQVLSHLVSTLCIAYVSQADKVKAPTAPARQTRNQMWGPPGQAQARPAQVRRPPFAPSESTISSMSDQMGFPREQVEFVVNRLQTNEVAVLANYFLEHDVESIMRASQVSAARREAATTTAAAAVPGAAAGTAAAAAAGGAAVSGAAAVAGGTDAAADDAAVPEGTGEAGAAAEVGEGEAMAVVEEPDVLAQALKDSLHVASNQGVESEAPEGLGLPDVAAIGEGLLQLSLEQPQHVFVLCPLLQQAAEGSPEQLLEWASSKIKTLFPAKVCSRYLFYDC